MAVQNNYLLQYKSFVNGHHLSEGLRITTGVVLPALIFGYFDNVSTGIVLSIGALMVSVTDSPGPVHHRRNGMVACLLFIVVGALITGLVSSVWWALPVFLVAACFFFSMMTVYGPRATAIGTAGMLIIVLTIDPRRQLSSLTDIVLHAMYIGIGGLWYLCYSLLLYNFRPLRLAQQAMGDCMEATALYLELRASLYKRGADQDALFSRILQQQATVQQKQNDLSELLFKTRSITRDSNVVSRALVMMFLDLTDIFEKIMTSHQQYALLHTYFDDSGILDQFYRLATDLAQQLNTLGVAVKSGESTTLDDGLPTRIKYAHNYLDQLRHDYLNQDNIDGFISLRKILENIEDIAERIRLLHQYSTFDKKLLRKQPNIDRQSFITSQDYSLGVLRSNLTLRSDSFRYAIRLSSAVLLGFLLSQAMKVGHSYWVLLTIIVIIKPAYSLTKKRNGQRLAGTIAGVLIGVGVLYLTTNSRLLLAILIVFMLLSYSNMRKNYFLSVLFMTPYLVIFYHLLTPGDFNTLLKDRIIDTAIGSVIAFVASYTWFPSWEKNKIRQSMLQILLQQKAYLETVVSATKRDRSERQVKRKNALVALANLSDSFNRMLSEPESRQHSVELVHKFVLLAHMLTSYIAGLANLMERSQPLPEQITHATDGILSNLANAIAHLQGEAVDNDKERNKALQALVQESALLLEQRKEELKHGWKDSATRLKLTNVKPLADQLNLVNNVTNDLVRLSAKYAATANQLT